MSRIDEALKRAAQQDGETAEPLRPGVRVAAEPADLEALARESFPIEIDAHRTRLHVAAPDTTRAAAASLAEPAAETRETNPPPTPLLERLDARFTEKLVADMKMAPGAREQYRRLVAMLHDAQGNAGLRAVMVASALPGEGKTLTAANVALTLTESYHRRVLLIDADLRKPALHEMFSLTTTTGLSDGLESADVKLVLRQVSARLWVLPAGRPTADPMAALTSDRMRRVIEEAKDAFDWIIIDTPPLIALTDAHLLSSLVDSTVLVVKAKSTPYAMVKRTAEIIGRDRIIGVVLNQADGQGHGGYAENYAAYYASALNRDVCL